MIQNDFVLVGVEESLFPLIHYVMLKNIVIF